MTYKRRRIRICGEFNRGGRRGGVSGVGRASRGENIRAQEERVYIIELCETRRRCFHIRIPPRGIACTPLDYRTRRGYKVRRDVSYGWECRMYYWITSVVGRLSQALSSHGLSLCIPKLRRLQRCRNGEGSACTNFYAGAHPCQKLRRCSERPPNGVTGTDRLRRRHRIDN